jgi:hypothetical protein
VLAAAGSVVRPIAETPIHGVPAVTDVVGQLVAETSEQMHDLVAEVRNETSGNGGERKRPTPIHH